VGQFTVKSLGQLSVKSLGQLKVKWVGQLGVKYSWAIRFLSCQNETGNCLTMNLQFGLISGNQAITWAALSIEPTKTLKKICTRIFVPFYRWYKNFGTTFKREGEGRYLLSARMLVGINQLDITSPFGESRQQISKVERNLNAEAETCVGMLLGAASSASAPYLKGASKNSFREAR